MEEFVIDKEVLALVGKLLGNNYIMPQANSFLGELKSGIYPVTMKLDYYSVNDRFCNCSLECYWADLYETNAERIETLNSRVPAYLQGLCSQLEFKKYKVCVQYSKDLYKNSCTINFYKRREVADL